MKLLAPILFFIIAFTGFFMYIRPGYQEITELRTKSKLFAQAMSEVNSVTQQRDEVANQYNSLATAEIKRLEKFLPDEVDTLQLIIDINALAKKYGTSVKDIGIEKNTSTIEPYGIVNLTFKTTMPYENFLRFLADLEQSLKLVDVGSVAFDPNAEGSTSAYTYDVTLNTYYLK